MAIKIESRYEFITQLFDFFKVERTNNLVTAYDIALTTRYPVDWVAFFEEIVRTTEKRSLPMPKYFSDRIRQFKKRNVEITIDEGSILRIYLKNGYYYDFTVCNTISTETTLSKVKKRFGEDVAKIIKYPPETTLIGDSEFFNVNIPKKTKMTEQEKNKYIEQKEQELRSQVKTIFLAQAS